uniref:RRM domain-containing protein n=1 Tax=Araucaria cunninghamii TaxID=56994 RepID=A0A0D6R306_ARACU
MDVAVNGGPGAEFSSLKAGFPVTHNHQNDTGNDSGPSENLGKFDDLPKKSENFSNGRVAQQNGHAHALIHHNLRDHDSSKDHDEEEGDSLPNGKENNNDDAKENGHHNSNDNHNDDSRDMNELVDLLSKLNPMAKEFVPHSLANSASNTPRRNGANNNGNARRRNGYNQARRRTNSRISTAQREESIRKTIFVSDIDQLVTEEQLAALFINCGQVVDCRVCGDPNSVLRFAFVEFTDEASARRALSLSGTMLGYYPVRVLPSKTAILPVNPTFLPTSEDERELCARTIYCTNIDKKVSQADVKLFFESFCGKVSRLRLLGDYQHLTRIAFVEFVYAHSAMAALNCSGAILGSLPIRVSPSKTPVRPRNPRPQMH